MDQIKKSLRFFGFCCCVCVVIIWFSPINQANAAETKMISEATVAPVEMEQEAEEDETVEIEIGLNETEDLTDPNHIAEQMDWGDLDHMMQELQDYFAEHLSGFDLQQIWKAAKQGEIQWDLKTVLQFLGQFLFQELTQSGGFMIQLVVLAILAMVLHYLQDSFNGTVATLSHGVVYLVLISLALQVFVIAGTEAKETVHLMSDFLYALTPTLCTLLVAMGGVSSVSLFHPAMLGAVSVAIHLISAFILPAVYFSGALVVASYITPRLAISKMAKLVKDVALWALGIIFTLFTAFLGILGIAGASIDGLAIKAAKSASGFFIPIIGRSIADVLDTVISTALVLKNVIGVLGIIVILLLIVVPAIKILVMALLFRLAAAFVQPLGEAQLAEALQGLGNVVMMFFAVVAASGIFFFFLISIVIGMGNLTVALR